MSHDNTNNYNHAKRLLTRHCWPTTFPKLRAFNSRANCVYVDGKQLRKSTKLLVDKLFGASTWVCLMDCQLKCFSKFELWTCDWDCPATCVWSKSMWWHWPCVPHYILGFLRALLNLHKNQERHPFYILKLWVMLLPDEIEFKSCVGLRQKKRVNQIVRVKHKIYVLTCSKKVSIQQEKYI